MSGFPPIRAVIYDYDGTLVDSFGDGLRCIRLLASTHGLPYNKETEGRFLKHWGAPGKELLSEGFAISEKRAQALLEEWQRYNHECPPHLITAADRTLALLGKRGLVAALVTSRDRNTLFAMLKRDKLAGSFARITSREDCPYAKPDARVFDSALLTFSSEFGIERRECVVVGDTFHDIAAARNAGMRMVLVRTGLYGRISPPNMDPENILASVVNLPEWVRQENKNCIIAA